MGDDQGVVLQVAAAQVDESGGDRRHDTGKRYSRDLRPVQAVVVEQAAQEHGVFVRLFGPIGGDPPVRDPAAFAVQAEGGVGVVDIDGQQHAASVAWNGSHRNE